MFPDLEPKSDTQPVSLSLCISNIEPVKFQNTDAIAFSDAEPQCDYHFKPISHFFSITIADAVAVEQRNCDSIPNSDTKPISNTLSIPVNFPIIDFEHFTVDNCDYFALADSIVEPNAISDPVANG